MVTAQKPSSVTVAGESCHVACVSDFGRVEGPSCDLGVRMRGQYHYDFESRGGATVSCSSRAVIGGTRGAGKAAAIEDVCVGFERPPKEIMPRTTDLRGTFMATEMPVVRGAPPQGQWCARFP